MFSLYEGSKAAPTTLFWSKYDYQNEMNGYTKKDSSEF